MIVRSDETLSVGWKVGSVDPPELSLTVVAKAICPLTPRRLKADPSPPGVRGDLFEIEGEPGSGLRYPSDLVPFKPNTDILLRGDAWAPDGKPAASVPVSLSIAGVRKSILVTGDRTWQPVPGDERRMEMSAPEPFISMHLARQRAFGGPGSEKNPLGCGLNCVQSGGRLPNIEDPAHLISTITDTPEPVGVGPIPADHHPRAAMIGTFDDSYAKTRWPWMPADADWRHSCAAPIDQQTTGYVRGDELLRLRNVVQGAPDFWTHLPGLRVRWLMRVKDRRGVITAREVPMNLDTVYIDAKAGNVVLVWRGVTPAARMKLGDVESMFATTEALGSSPRSAEDLWKGFDAGIEAQGKLPPDVAEEIAKGRAAIAQAEVIAQEKLSEACAQRDAFMARAEQNKAAAAGQAERLSTVGNAVVGGGVGVGGEVGGAIDRASVTGVTAASVAAARALPAAAVVLPAALPESPVRAQVNQLKQLVGTLRGRGMSADDPKLREIFKGIADLELLDARQGRSMISLQRLDVIAAVGRRESLAGLGMASLDLSGIDFSGIDLRGAVLAESNLSGAVLSGADLSGAVLYKANLRGADLSGAGCDKVIFTEARLEGAVLTGLSVSGAVFIGMDLRGKILTGWKGRAPLLNDAKLDGVVFGAAQIPAASFIGASMHHVDLSGADIQGAQFIGVQGQGMDLSGASAGGLQASPGVDMRFTDFSGMRGIGSNFGGARLEGADFSDAVLSESIFAEALISHGVFRRVNLAGTDLSDCDLSRCIFEDAHLARAMIERSRADGARFLRTGAWSAGFWLTDTRQATFEACNLRGSSLA